MSETCEACGQPASALCPDGYDDDCCDAADHNHWEPDAWDRFAATVEAVRRQFDSRQN